MYIEYATTATVSMGSQLSLLSGVWHCTQTTYSSQRHPSRAEGRDIIIAYQCHSLFSLPAVPTTPSSVGWGSGGRVGPQSFCTPGSSHSTPTHHLDRHSLLALWKRAKVTTHSTIKAYRVQNILPPMKFSPVISMLAVSSSGSLYFLTTWLSPRSSS